MVEKFSMFKSHLNPFGMHLMYTADNSTLIRTQAHEIDFIMEPKWAWLYDWSAYMYLVIW